MDRRSPDEEKPQEPEKPAPQPQSEPTPPPPATDPGHVDVPGKTP